MTDYQHLQPPVLCYLMVKIKGAYAWVGRLHTHDIGLPPPPNYCNLISSRNEIGTLDPNFSSAATPVIVAVEITVNKGRQLSDSLHTNSDQLARWVPVTASLFEIDPQPPPTTFTTIYSTRPSENWHHNGFH